MHKRRKTKRLQVRPETFALGAGILGLLITSPAEAGRPSGEIPLGPEGHFLSAKQVTQAVHDYVVATFRAASGRVKEGHSLRNATHTIERKGRALHVSSLGLADSPIAQKTTSVWISPWQGGYASFIRQTWTLVDSKLPAVSVTSRASSTNRLARWIEVGGVRVPKNSLGQFIKSRLGRGALGRIHKHPRKGEIGRFYAQRNHFRKGRL